MQSLVIPKKSDSDNQWDSSSEMNEKGKKRKISLTSCGTCNTEEARYRCPGCLVHSCSLVCVKKHKVETGCSGVRDKTAFVPLSEFDEITLLSDYRFLEETGRLADSATRDASAQLPQQAQRVQKLVKQARMARMTLKILPRTFTKRKENSTFYHRKEGRFYWHLKLFFPQSGAEYTERRVPDNQTLEEILRLYIHPTESDPVRRQKLKIYAHTPQDHLRVFMKAEENRPNSLSYHELDLKKSLKDNLLQKTIMEYPALHVTLKDHCQDYLTQRRGGVWTPSYTTAPPGRAPPEQTPSGPAVAGTEAEAGRPKADPHGNATGPARAVEKKVKRAPISEADLEDGEILSEEEEEGGCNDQGDAADGAGSNISHPDHDDETDEDVGQENKTNGDQGDVRPGDAGYSDEATAEK